MSTMVCNANSLGDIDYGLPVTKELNDYRTSTKLYTEYHHPPIRAEYYNVKPIISESILNDNTSLKNEYYKTTSGLTWTNKSNASNIEKHYRGGRCTNQTFMKNVEQDMFLHPPIAAQPNVSEYNGEYKIRPTKEVLFRPCFETTFPMQTHGLEIESRVKLENPGVYKLLDPYVTNTRLNHFMFTPEQIKRASLKNVSFYSSKDDPEIYAIKEPINDKVKFKRPTRNRVIPEKLCTVPHVFESSYESSYKTPISNPLYTRIFESVDFPVSLAVPDLGQALCAPAMYCTEYCHITGWPPRAVVQPHRDTKMHLSIREPRKK